LVSKLTKEDSLFESDSINMKENKIILVAVERIIQFSLIDRWRRMRWAGHVAHVGEERGAYRVLVGKPEGKRPLGRPRHRWVYNIIMNLQEVGCGYVDWIGLAQDRDRWWTLVSVVMNLRVP
jgi:hypothetical protein